MLLNAIVFDAAMTASAALARLARNGLWLDPRQAEASRWIQVNSGRLGRPFDEVASKLARDPHNVGAAIRRQWYASVLWYPRSALDVLRACASAAPDELLVVALGLREEDARSPVRASRDGREPESEGVVFEAGVPIAVNFAEPAFGRVPSTMSGGDGGRLPDAARSIPALDDGGAAVGAMDGNAAAYDDYGASRSTRGAPAPAAPIDVRAWPRVEAPDYVPAQHVFDVIVGFGAARQARVAGGPLSLQVPAGTRTVELRVELVVDGVDALDGWTRAMTVDVTNPAAAKVTFQLRGRDVAGPEPVHLTMLEVRYVYCGSICGHASRPLVIGHVTAPTLDIPAHFGTPWLAQPAMTSSLAMQPAADAPDLTIELAKPDGNGANGRFVCRLLSPHAIDLDAGPHEIDLGDDAKTFARALVDQVRQYARSNLADNLFRSYGDLIAEKLPPAVFDALQKIATRVAPQPPMVLLASAEPYVPWELARLPVPLDPKRPPYLGAQTLLGRWMRGSSAPSASGGRARAEKPATQPPAAIRVGVMAVMAGLYKPEAGLRRLPSAEEEAKTLAATYDAIALAASPQALRQLLDAKLERGFEAVGGADAVHFAGHGDFDPSRVDSSVLFLSDGTPLSSLLFRSASYGGEQQPLIFLNACMIGVGGELLGDMGGFPGNCLRGGFGGVLGALWEVDDKVAAQVALEFWRRALPKDGKSEPVASILRDLRAKYAAGDQRDANYLSYVYYGHPRLTLQRAAP